MKSKARSTSSRFGTIVPCLMQYRGGQTYVLYPTPEAKNPPFSMVTVEMHPVIDLPDFNDKYVTIGIKRTNDSCSQISYKGNWYLASVLGGLKND